MNPLNVNFLQFIVQIFRTLLSGSLLLVFTLTSLQSKSQINEFSTWYFGHNAGLTWKVLQPNGDPSPLFDGQINTMEAVATISDSYGNLLFYTDGSTVYNRLHLPMTNSLMASPGGKLKGNSSSACLFVVPNPIDQSIFYIFTVGAQLHPDGLCYSKIDLSLDGGLGNVDLNTKNVCLYTPSTEKIAGIKHANGVDTWVITHPWNSNQFYTYLVNGYGVQSNNPVISTCGALHELGYLNSVGTMKSSISGNKLAYSIVGTSTIEYFDFNTLTGEISNAKSISTNLTYNAYGVEFSPNEHLLYVSNEFYSSNPYEIAGLYQYNINLPNISDVASSKTTIYERYGGFGAIQYANDGKMYVSPDDGTFISTINNPDSLGLSCNFELNAISLNSECSTNHNAALGLPTILTSYFDNPKKFTYSNCNNPTIFEISDTSNIDQVFWNFNYPSTDPQFLHTDSLFSASFQYSQPGTYYVELKVERLGYFDSSLQQIFVEFPMQLNLGPDTILCTDQTLNFDLSYLNANTYTQDATFSWHAQIENMDYYGSTDNYSIVKPGIYSVTVSGNSFCDDVSDEIVVEYNNVVADFGYDSLITTCVQSPVMLNASYLNSSFGPVSYLWNTSQITPAITPLQSGTYSVTVSSGFCQAENSIQVNYDNPLVSPFSSNFYLCEDSSLVISALNPGASYHWSTAEQTPELLVNSIGAYIVTISNACGSLIDSANVFLITNGQILLEDTTFKCENSNLFLSVVSSVPNEQYLWNNAETMGFIEVMNDGLYRVTVSNQCGSYADSTLVVNEHPLSGFLGNDTIVCPGYLLHSLEPGGSYYWLSGETSASIPITSAGTYYLEISNSCGVYWDETTLGLLATDFEIELGPDTTICLGDIIYLSTGSNYEHVWSDLSTDSILIASTAGVYSVTVSNSCYSHSDTLVLDVDENTFSFEIDTLFLTEGESEIIAASLGYESYLWSTGQTSFWIEVNAPGVYSLTTMDDFGCLALDSIIVKPLIGIASLETSHINIFPNPSSKSESVQVTNLPLNSTLFIYSQWGELIMSFPIVQKDFLLSFKSLPTGVYTLLIQDAHHTQFLKWVRL